MSDIGAAFLILAGIACIPALVMGAMGFYWIGVQMTWWR